MASFDFIDAASKGYEFSWRNRSYLARVAIPVFIVKVFCLLSVYMFSVEDNRLREGMILMPGYFVEGLLVIGIIRFMIFKEPIFIWGKPVIPPVPDSKRDLPTVVDSGELSPLQARKAGLAIYLLSIIVVLIASSFVPSEASIEALKAQSQDPEASKNMGAILGSPFIFVAILLSILWSVRLFWLYVPVAMGCSIGKFLTIAQGFRLSICLVLAWLVCTLPLSILYEATASLPDRLFDDENMMHVIMSSIFRAAAEIIVLSVQVSAISYGILTVLIKKPSK